MTVLVKPTRTTVELRPAGASTVLIATQQNRTVVVSLEPNRGISGEQGPAGDGTQSDPGDFTLIFENQLI